MSGRDDFVTALEAIMAREREELGDPPTPEELLAYRDGRLDPAARETIEAKIAVYPEAARVLADLAAFPDIEPRPDTPELSEDDITARWQSFRRRAEELPPPEPLPAPVPVRRRLPWRSSWPLAAAVLLSTGLGLVVGYFAGKASAPENPRRPAKNVILAELTPIGQNGFRAPAEPVELPPASDELLLVLALPGTEPFSTYTAELHDHQGTRLWSGDGLQPTPEGNIQLSFPRDTLAPGLYRIDLFGVDRAGATAKAATYELRVL